MNNQNEISLGFFEEIKKAEHPAILRSGGLGPGTAIGIYNKKNKTGYMLHEACFLYANLEESLEKIKKDYTNLDNLKVYVTGNSLSSDDTKEQRNFELENRTYVENTLKKYFNSKQIKFDWLEDDLTTELILDLKTGKFSTEVEHLEDLINTSYDEF
jgi:hypothetical protein